MEEKYDAQDDSLAAIRWRAMRYAGQSRKYLDGRVSNAARAAHARALLLQKLDAAHEKLRLRESH